MVIETERLLLRSFLEGDAADVFEYLKEPMVNCFACMKLGSLEEARTEMKNRIGETEYCLCEKLGMRREGLFMEFVSFVNNPDGTPRYENTYQYAILMKEWHCVFENA